MQIIATKYFKPKETIASGNYPELATFPVEKNIIEDTVTYRDLFDTEIMGAMTPKATQIIEKFEKLYF